MANDFFKVPLDQNTAENADANQDAPLSYIDVFSNQVTEKDLQRNPGALADDGFQIVGLDTDSKRKLFSYESAKTVGTEATRQETETTNEGAEAVTARRGRFADLATTRVASSREAAIEQALTTPLADGVPPGTGEKAEKNKAENTKTDTTKADTAKEDIVKTNSANSSKSDKPRTETPDEKALSTARDFEKRGREALEAAHKNLKVTTDGSAPRVVPMQDNFKVQKEATALDIAKEQLGPSATKDQLDSYALQVSLNNASFDPKPGEIKFAQNPGDTKFPAGHSIKLPGQTADGGIMTRDRGVTKTEWVDGTSIQVHEDGQGNARFEKNGDMNTVHWNPNDPNENHQTITGTDIVTEIDAVGHSVEKKFVEKNKNTGEGTWVTSKITTSDPKGHQFVQEFKLGKPMPEKIIMTNPDKSVVELKPNSLGEYVSADGKLGIGSRFELYSRQTAADGSVTRTYDGTGNIETYNKQGKLVHSEGTDNWGRKASYDYKPGNSNPDKITITTKDGATVVLSRQNNGKYVGDNLEGGKKVGTINLGNDGRLIFNNDKNKSARTELQDGTVLEKRQNADKTSTVTLTRDKDTLVAQIDAKGQRTSETFTTGDGRKMVSNFKNNKIESVQIEGRDGSKTELKYDGSAQQLRGQRLDSKGNVLENVSYQEDKLVFVDVKTGALRAEKIDKPEFEGALPKFIKGTYNRDAGTFTYTDKDGQKTVESFAPGRSDVTKPDGTIVSSTVSGERSTIKPNGEATVLHANGSGVRLNADLTVDRWGANAGDNANREKLSPAEEKYLKSHVSVDHRDVAELHRRLGGDVAKLDAFYKELEKIDTAKNLTADERTALRKDILHHAAFPGEIYQGRSPSCNVSVVQRDVVMNSPDRYASQIVSAISDGEVTIAGGGKVKLDPANLKLQDSSGRDLASRIYQTMALSVQLDPRGVYRNTEDGVGRIYPSPFNPSDKPEVFAGLNIIQITDARYKLTGEEKALYQIESAAELEAAFKAGGGKPMIIAVNGRAKPFEGNGPVGNGNGANHVVTVIGIENGKVLLHNQWGLANDHSTSKTAVDARQLVDNMQARVVINGKVEKIPGMVLSNGTHDRGYKFSRGRVVEDPSVHRNYRTAVEARPPASK